MLTLRTSRRLAAMRTLSTVTLIALSFVIGVLSNRWTLQADAAQAAPQGTPVRMQAPLDQAADFPLSELQSTYKDMDARKLLTMRLIEGGKYNVNIRRLN